MHAAKKRAEEGHKMAGRAPKRGARASGAVQKVDDAIRDPESLVTSDQRMLDSPHMMSSPDFRRNDQWRVMRMTSELVEGIDALAGIVRAVSVFGSARTAPADARSAATSSCRSSRRRTRTSIR
jgi:hypothetical protein